MTKQYNIFYDFLIVTPYRLLRIEEHVRYIVQSSRLDQSYCIFVLSSYFDQVRLLQMLRPVTSDTVSILLMVTSFNSIYHITGILYCERKALVFCIYVYVSVYVQQVAITKLDERPILTINQFVIFWLVFGVPHIHRAELKFKVY